MNTESHRQRCNRLQELLQHESKLISSLKIETLSNPILSKREEIISSNNLITLDSFVEFMQIPEKAKLEYLRRIYVKKE